MNVKSLHIALCIVFNICFYGYCQDNLDSLTNLLNSSTENQKPEILNALAKYYIYNSDTIELGIKHAKDARDIAIKYKNENELITALQYIGRGYRYIGQYDESLSFSREALEISKKYKNEEEIARSLINMGLLYFQISDFEKSIEYYKEAMVIKNMLGDKKGYGITLNNIGNSYFYLGNYNEAIVHFQKALEIFEEIQFIEGIASTLNGFGILYEQQSQYQEALKHYKKAYQLMEDEGNRMKMGNFLNNMGNVYIMSGVYDTAIIVYSEALNIRIKMKDKNGMGSSYSNLGLVYSEMGNFQQANEYYNKALEINSELNNIYNLALNTNAMARNFMRMGNYNKALEYSNRSIELSNNIISYEIEQHNYELLSDLYESMGDYKKAMAYYKKYSALKDTLISTEFSNRISELQVQYETKEKQQQLDILSEKNYTQQLKLERSRYLLTGLSLVIILVVFMAILLIRQKQLQAKQKTIELEQKLLRSQMNPHFIFNSLIAIQSFILKKQDKEAGKYLTGFAKLMRLVLENSRVEYVSLDREISTLEHYLELQMLRFDHKFDYNIKLDDNIWTENIAIPPMLAQPFIENSIEHGILNKAEKGHIEISFIQENGELLFILEDNGIGREKAMELKKEKIKKHESLATSITLERLSNLKRKNKKKFSLEIEDLKSDADEAMGTKVTIRISFKHI